MRRINRLPVFYLSLIIVLTLIGHKFDLFSDKSFAFPPPEDVYISSRINASDELGDGSEEKPFRSINRASEYSSYSNIRIASDPYVLSNKDVGDIASDSVVEFGQYKDIRVLPAYGLDSVTILPNPNQPDHTNLQILVKSNITFSRITFEDLGIALRVYNSGNLTLSQNDFNFRDFNNCHSLEISSDTWARVQINDNQFVSPRFSNQQNCQLLRLGSKNGIHKMDISNNSFKVLAPGSIRDAIFATAKNSRIYNNIFEANLLLKDPMQLVGVHGFKNSMPEVFDNDFNLFKGTPEYYE